MVAGGWSESHLLLGSARGDRETRGGWRGVSEG